MSTAATARLCGKRNAYNASICTRVVIIGKPAHPGACLWTPTAVVVDYSMYDNVEWVNGTHPRDDDKAK